MLQLVDVESLGFRTDLMVRRLSGSTITDEGDHLVVRTPDNPTFYWGNFLLLAQPLRRGDTARWLDVFASTFPEAKHVAIGVDGTSGAAGDTTDLVDAGLEIEVNTVLKATVLRGGGAVECRRLTTDDDWQQVGDVRVAAHSGDPQDPAEYETFVRRSVDQSRAMSKEGHAAWFGAFVGGEVRASLGIVSDGSGLARYQMVETHPDFRRRGLARSLLVEAARFARKEMHADTLVIVADPDYVAIDLYRRLGFRDAERQVQFARAG